MYLQGKVHFAPDGWPIMEREWFLDVWPDELVPYPNRNNKLYHNKHNSTLCYYCADNRIYPRFNNLFQEIGSYKAFQGVVGPDITVTRDMDIELQQSIMLANQLFMAILAVNGIKVVLNTRCGGLATVSCFRYLPKGIMCASGFLGCSNSRTTSEASIYVNKVLSLRPSKLLVYGKQDELVNQQLDTLGINYRYYEDFHRISCRRCV